MTTQVTPLDMRGFFQPHTLEAIARARTEAQLANRPTDVILMNPNRIAHMTLYGMRVIWDSTMPFNEIRVEGEQK